MTEDEERQADEVNIAFQMGAEWERKQMKARIEQLESSSEGWKEIADEYFDAIGERNTRIDKLEAALQKVLARCFWYEIALYTDVEEIVRKELEGKDD